MEVARAIKSLIDCGKIGRPKRTIRFLWVPEITGTYFWMHKHLERVKGQLAVINLDMVGEHPVHCGYPLNLIKVPDSVPNYLNDLVSYLLEYVADHPKGVEPLEGWKAGINYRVEKHCGGSDHICFTDSFFGIPAIMFYNPDQFHHTSLDTLDKVDTSKLQRVGVVAGAATLVVANADEQSAVALATLTRGRGYARIGEAASEVMEELLYISVSGSENLSFKLGTAYVRGMRKIEIVAERESKNVLSVQKLNTSPAIEILGEGFREFAEGEKARIRVFYKALCTRLGLEPMEEEHDSEALRTMKLVPKKEFEGPAPSIPIDKLKKEDRDWLAEFGRMHNPHRNYTLVLGGPTLEFMNFIDGKRSIYEIAMLVNAEYGNIEPVEAKRFFDICNQVGFISYKEMT